MAHGHADGESFLVPGGVRLRLGSKNALARADDTPYAQVLAMGTHHRALTLYRLYAGGRPLGPNAGPALAELLQQLEITGLVAWCEQGPSHGMKARVNAVLTGRLRYL